MKAGVSTGPCGVTKTPARAAPALCWTVNEKLIGFSDNLTQIGAVTYRSKGLDDNLRQ
jgi:hypothetical protein